MKVGTRIVFSLLMVIFIAVCAYIFCISVGFIDGFIFYVDDSVELYIRYIIAVVAAFLAVIAFCLLFFRSGKSDKISNRVILAQTEGASISITTDAIKELAGNYLRSIDGINVNNITIKPVSETGVSVNSAISVEKDVQMPQITQRITEEIKAYIELYSGVSVEKVNLNVQPLKANV